MRLVKSLDLGVQGVDLVEQHAGRLGVVVVEAAGEGLEQGSAFGPHSSLGHLGEHARITLAGDQRLDHGPARHPEDIACLRSTA